MPTDSEKNYFSLLDAMADAIETLRDAHRQRTNDPLRTDMDLTSALAYYFAVEASPWLDVELAVAEVRDNFKVCEDDPD